MDLGKKSEEPTIRQSELISDDESMPEDNLSVEKPLSESEIREIK